jgi:hypothetical protein
MTETPSVRDRVTVAGRTGIWVVIDVDPGRRRLVVVPERDCWCRSCRLVDLARVDLAPAAAGEAT